MALAIAFLIGAGVVAAASRPTSDGESPSIVASTTSTPSTAPTTALVSTIPPETTAPDTTPPPPVIAAVGDSVCSPSHSQYNDGNGTPRNCRARGVAGLAQSLNPAAVLLLGDLQYECGRADEWGAFDLAWGGFGERLRPAIGNHEYGHECGADDADAYFNYFGARAGDFGHGWYSFDLGDWHLIALNSECSYGGGAVGGCSAGTEQHTWLRNDLASHPAQCTLAYWHEPRFSSGQHGNAEQMTVIWNDLARAGVDVVLTGHEHAYERFDPIGVSFASPAFDPTGIRQFVVGTGGKNFDTFPGPALAGEVVRNDDTYGVLGMTLRPGGYDWQFLPLEGGGGFTDSGSGDCH